MSREEKLEIIYKEMANKELTFGCKFQVIESVGPIQGVIFNVVPEGYKVLWDHKRITTETKNSDLTVIGHPVMIGDVMHYIRKKYWNNHSRFHSDRSKLIDLWSKEREPIEGQYNECIDFVYSLIKK